MAFVVHINSTREIFLAEVTMMLRMKMIWSPEIADVTNQMCGGVKGIEMFVLLSRWYTGA